MKRAIFITLLLTFCLSAVVSAQTARTLTVAGIDAYCKTIDEVTEKRKSADGVFVDVWDYEENENAKWQGFDSETALEDPRGVSSAIIAAISRTRTNT